MRPPHPRERRADWLAPAAGAPSKSPPPSAGDSAPKAGDSRTSSSSSSVGGGGGAGYLGSVRDETEAGERQRPGRTGLLLPAFLLGSSRFRALLARRSPLRWRSEPGGRGAKKAGFAGKGEDTASVPRASPLGLQAMLLALLPWSPPPPLRIEAFVLLPSGPGAGAPARRPRLVPLSVSRRAGKFQAEAAAGGARAAVGSRDPARRALR
ncbi:putative G-protein coupled receptor 63 isoform X2 [Pogona vitticeps]